jgi:hemerythrin
VGGIAWNHACVVGVRAMDDQHGILVDTLNELRRQVMRGADQVQMSRLLGRLKEFAGLHFGCEENLLERHGFPELAGHRAAHRTWMIDIHRAIACAERGEVAEVQRRLTSLHVDYIDHVEGLDREYGDWLNARGIY